MSPLVGDSATTVSFQTSQRLVGHVRKLIKKGWFSDLEILEIRQKTNYELDTNTVSDTRGFDKQEESSRSKPTTSEIETPHTPNNTQQALTQEQKINLEN